MRPLADCVKIAMWPNSMTGGWRPVRVPRRCRRRGAARAFRNGAGAQALTEIHRIENRGATCQRLCPAGTGNGGRGASDPTDSSAFGDVVGGLASHLGNRNGDQIRDFLHTDKIRHQNFVKNIMRPIRPPFQALAAAPDPSPWLRVRVRAVAIEPVALREVSHRADGASESGFRGIPGGKTGMGRGWRKGGEWGVKSRGGRWG